MKKKVLIIVAMILLVAGLGYVGYMQFNKNNSKTVEDKKVEKEIVNLDIESAEFKGIYNKVATVLKDYKNKNLTKEELIANALINMNSSLINVCTNEYTKTIRAHELNMYNRMNLSDNYELTLEDIQNADQNEVRGLTYGLYELKVDEEDIYPIENCDGKLGPSQTFESEKVVKATREGNNIYIYVKVAFAKLNDEYVDGIEYLLYDNPDFTGEAIEKTTEAHFTGEYNIQWDKYKTYKYTIKDSNKLYLYESFELDK